MDVPPFFGVMRCTMLSFYPLRTSSQCYIFSFAEELMEWRYQNFSTLPRGKAHLELTPLILYLNTVLILNIDRHRKTFCFFGLVASPHWLEDSVVETNMLVSYIDFQDHRFFTSSRCRNEMVL